MGMVGMSDHAKEKLYDQTVAWISYCMSKTNFLSQIVFEILKFKKLRNLTGQEHFQLKLKS